MQHCGAVVLFLPLVGLQERQMQGISLGSAPDISFAICDCFVAIRARHCYCELLNLPSPHPKLEKVPSEESRRCWYSYQVFFCVCVCNLFLSTFPELMLSDHIYTVTSPIAVPTCQTNLEGTFQPFFSMEAKELRIHMLKLSIAISD